jgi:hypothetical protein
MLKNMFKGHVTHGSGGDFYFPGPADKIGRGFRRGSSRPKPTDATRRIAVTSRALRIVLDSPASPATL